MAEEKKEETGGEILDALMKQVGEQVDGKVKREPNKSKTYTRLLLGGKAFAYVFPPGNGRVSVKIPKQLLGVQTSLPAGHGFKKTNWGLTRTVTSTREVPKVAKALAVAATEVAKKKEPVPA